VQGASMQPNFMNGDYLLIDEVSYRFRAPERDDVVVFKNPNNESEFYIKRVIGLPGERLSIKENKIMVNGKEIEESYIPIGIKYFDETDVELKSDEYFVMGDNRPQSFDSRRWGPLKKYEIIGVVRLRFWPLDKLQLFQNA